MKRVLAGLCSLALVISPSAATAENGCYGCNVVDEQVLDSYLVGRTIYYEGTRGVVDSVDTYNDRAYVRLDDGRSGWADATKIYTAGSQRERDSATGTAVAVGAVVVLCMLFCSSSDRGNSSASSSSSSSSGNGYNDYGGQSRSPPPPPPPPAAREPQVPGLYGNCHGGTAYGCDR